MKHTPKTPVSDNLVKEVMGLVNACNATEPALPEHARQRLQAKVQAQHTPTPWTYDPVWSLIVGDKGVEVAALHAAQLATEKRANPERVRANAEFLCRAVNSHADLLQALRDITPPMPPPDAPCHAGICPQSECIHCHRIARARAAIAKAEKGEA